MHWKTCSSVILANAKLVGNDTSRCSNHSISNFSLLKNFGVCIHPRRPLKVAEVMWYPPPLAWIKAYIDGFARGNPSLISYGSIFWDDKACLVGGFSAFLGEGTPELADLLTAIIVMEKAEMFNWKKLWIETDCSHVVKAFSNSNLVPWKITSRWHMC